MSDHHSRPHRAVRGRRGRRGRRALCASGLRRIAIVCAGVSALAAGLLLAGCARVNVGPAASARPVPTAAPTVDPQLVAPGHAQPVAGRLADGARVSGTAGTPARHADPGYAPHAREVTPADAVSRRANVPVPRRPLRGWQGEPYAAVVAGQLSPPWGTPVRLALPSMSRGYRVYCIRRSSIIDRGDGVYRGLLNSSTVAANVRNRGARRCKTTLYRSRRRSKQYQLCPSVNGMMT